MKKNKFICAVSLIITVILAMSACVKPDQEVPKEGYITLADAITVDFADGSVSMPYTLQGEKSKIEWKSSNRLAAFINEDEKIVPIGEGETIITATMNGEDSQCKVFITREYSVYTVISTAEQFKSLAASGAYTSQSKRYCLGNDIDFDGETIQPLGGWDVDSKDSGTKHNFNATFDGRGYALKNFKIVQPESCISKVEEESDKVKSAKANEQYFGVSLFPRIQKGTVRNLNLIGVDFEGYGFTGGIAGICEAGVIENCYVQGKIKATAGYTDSVPSGGIVGIMGAKAVVSNCFIDLEIEGGNVFCGFNFGSGAYCNAVSELLDDKMMFQAKSTGKDNPHEDAKLTTFKITENKRLQNSEMDDLENYMFKAFENPFKAGVYHTPKWAVADGYKAFLPRPDGLTPNWAIL